MEDSKYVSVDVLLDKINTIYGCEFEYGIYNISGESVMLITRVSREIRDLKIEYDENGEISEILLYNSYGEIDNMEYILLFEGEFVYIVDRFHISRNGIKNGVFTLNNFNAKEHIMSELISEFCR